MHGHQAYRQRRIRHCACGCGQMLYNRKRYVTGHRPKRAAMVRSPFKREKSPSLLLFSGLAGLEKAVGEKLKAQVEGGTPLTDEQNRKYERYQNLKGVALGGLTAINQETKNEAQVALKFAVAQMLDLVKLVF